MYNAYIKLLLHVPQLVKDDGLKGPRSARAPMFEAGACPRINYLGYRSGSKKKEYAHLAYNTVSSAIDLSNTPSNRRKCMLQR